MDQDASDAYSVDSEKSSQEREDPISIHLLNNKDVLLNCYDGTWTWFATTDRVIKYRSGSGTETMHDISYDEIQGISIQTETESEGAIPVLSGLLVIFLIADEWFLNILNIYNDILEFFGLPITPLLTLVIFVFQSFLLCLERRQVLPISSSAGLV
jgi:hypothetical protein